MRERAIGGLWAGAVIIGCGGCYMAAPPPEQPAVQGQATAGGQVQYAAQPQAQATYVGPQAQATYVGSQAQATYAVQQPPPPQAQVTYAVEPPQAQVTYVAQQPAPQAYPSAQITYGNDYVAQHMAMRRQQFAANMVEASPLRRGVLGQGQDQRFQAVLQAGNCYRVIGVGGDGIADLDLFIQDENGNTLAQDTATDNFPVLGLGDDMVCPRWTGNFYIRALAYSGSGEYGVQLFAAR